MLLLIATLLLYRYYAKQREEFNTIFVALRENVSQDLLAVYGLGIAAGQASRDLYQEYSPKAISLYTAAKEAIETRFPRRDNEEV